MDPIIFYENEGDFNKIEKSFYSLLEIDVLLSKKIWESGVFHKKLLEKIKNYDKDGFLLDDNIFSFIFFMMDISYKENFIINNTTSLWVLKFLDNNQNKDLNFYNLKSKNYHLKKFLIDKIILLNKWNILFNYFILFTPFQINMNKISFSEITNTLQTIIPLIKNKNFTNLNEMYQYFCWANPFFHFSYLNVNTKLLFSLYFEMIKQFLPLNCIKQINSKKYKNQKSNFILNLFNSNHFDTKQNSQLLNEIGLNHFKVGVLCNFFHKNHSVAKDRILYLSFLKNKLNWNITIYSHYQKSNLINKELINALNNINWIKLKPNDFDENKNFIINQNLDIIIFPEIGMDEKIYFLATSARYATIQINFWGHSDTSGILGLIDEYWMSEYFYEKDMEHNQFIEKVRIFEDLTTIYPKINLEEIEFNKILFLNKKDNFNKKIINIFCGYAFMKINDFLLNELNEISKYFDMERKEENIKFIFLDPKLEKREFDEWILYLKTHFSFLFKNIIFFNSLSTQNYQFLLSQCDLFIDSYPFGSCNSILEAMALGVDVCFIPSKILAGRFALGFKKFIEKTENDIKQFQNKEFILAQKERLEKRGKLIECETYNKIIKIIIERLDFQQV